MRTAEHESLVALAVPVRGARWQARARAPKSKKGKSCHSPYVAYYDACFTIKLYVRGSTPLPPLAPLTFCGQQHTISECAAVRPDSASSLNPTPPCLGGPYLGGPCLGEPCLGEPCL